MAAWIMKHGLVIFLLYCCHIGFIVCVAKTKANMLTLNDCEKPDHDYDQINKLDHFMELYQENNVTYARANFTIKKRTLPVYFSFRGYSIKDSEKKLDFRFEHISCSHPVVRPVLSRFRVRYNPKDCTGYPGTYHADKYNLNDVAKDYNFYSLFSLGTYIIEMEYVTAKGCIMCYAVKLRLWK